MLGNLYQPVKIGEIQNQGLALDVKVFDEDGKSIEELGFYNPMTDETHLKSERIKARLDQGAQPTDTVRNIFTRAKILS